jgi:hypothetical protein
MDRRVLINNRLINLFLTILVVSLPDAVKCDMGDTISSMILFMIIAIFIFAGLGWWSRRQEGSK